MKSAVVPLSTRYVAPAMNSDRPQHDQATASVWMTRREAAAYASISTRTLSRWNLAASKVGRTVRYHRDDVDTFLLRHRVEIADPLPKPSARHFLRRTRRSAPSAASLVDELIGLLKT